MTAYKLSEICQVLNGRAYKQSELLQAGKYPVLRVGNFFSSDRWYYSNLELPTEKYCNKGDLLFAWSASFGPRIWNGGKTIYHYHIWKMIPDLSIVDKHYLYYWLLNSVDALTAGNHGSVMGHMTKSEMENQQISLPSLSAQQKISRLLRSLDDKIELNNRISENLEQQAQALYRELFVSKPNAVSAVCRAEEFFDISIGKTPPRKEPQWFTHNPNEVTWVSIADMGKSGLYISESSEQLTKDAISKFNVKVVPDNTVLLSFKLTVGRVAITDGEMTTNEAIAHFVTQKPEIIEYLYCYLKDFNYQTMGSTSSIATAVNSKIIKAMPFQIPEESLLEQYHAVVGPMFAKIKANQAENKRLATIRDQLLPKLMSGELDVSEVNI